MTTGLIGSTGFVGGTILGQRPVDAAFHRPDVAQVRGARFDRLWVAGAPAQKWVANGDPEGDRAALSTLAEHLRHVTASSVVLISTVDVYPVPFEVDESFPVQESEHPEAYGRNRLWFEAELRQHFDELLVVRLPGLFGRGLRKNLIFDLLHEREEFAHRDSVFQFYDLSRLCDDVDAAFAAGLRLVNLATEPLAARRIAEEVFGRTLHREEGVPARYDLRTLHARTFDRQAPGPYLQSAEEVLERLDRFVAAERTATA